MDFKRLLADTLELDGVGKDEIYAAMTIPKDVSMGDFCFPCFKYAKAAGTSPRDLAEKLAASADRGDFLADVKAVGGYVNFTLKGEFYAARVIEEITRLCDAYGGGDEGSGKTVCIDYSSVNIAKPFHMGHLLNTVIGGALCRIYRALGYRVAGINHLGDWGTQFGKLIVAYKRWNGEEAEKRGIRGLSEIYVRFHAEAKSDPSLDDEARTWFKKIEDGDEEAVTLWKRFKDITLAEVDKIYKRLNVTFDSYAGESFYNDKMSPVLDELRRKGLLEVSEGAQVVKFENDEMPPCLMVKADGATLYSTRDIAAAFYRKRVYDFDKCLYVVAYQQNLHFRQLFKVIEMMGYAWYKDLVHVAHGMVSLEDGAMSTREGNVVFLEDVLDKAAQKALDVINAKNPDLEDKAAVAESVGTGAVVFGVLYNGRIKDVTFSYDKALNFDGETGPYVQYTYARCCSVIEKCDDADGEADMSGIADEWSRDVVRVLGRFPETVREAAEKYEPSLVARYTVNLAQAFNKFYIERKINVPESGIRNARVLLVKSVRQTLQNAMGLLGIPAPRRM